MKDPLIRAKPSILVKLSAKPLGLSLFGGFYCLGRQKNFFIITQRTQIIILVILKKNLGFFLVCINKTPSRWPKIRFPNLCQMWHHYLDRLMSVPKSRVFFQPNLANSLLLQLFYKYKQQKINVNLWSTRLMILFGQH